jgi:hypothetical protein
VTRRADASAAADVDDQILVRIRERGAAPGVFPPERARRRGRRGAEGNGALFSFSFVGHEERVVGGVVDSASSRASLAVERYFV